MLLSLGVKNLALIREAQIQFGEGLNILTGETGAGKSLVIGSVNLALGARAEKDIVRAGENEADIELVFSVDTKEQRAILDQLELPDSDEDVLVLRRTIRSGRSMARINDRTVTSTALKAVAEVMIDIHGQHEHQSLLYRRNHRKILDEFAGEKMEKLLRKTGEVYRQLRKIEEKLEEMPSDETLRKRQADLLQYEIGEIEKAGLRSGEDEELEEIYSKMKNARKLAGAVDAALMAAEGDDKANAAALIGYAAAALSEVSGMDEGLQELIGEITSIESLLSDFCKDAGEYLRSMEFSEEEFASVQDRLDEINRLKSKYGNSVDEIFRTLAQKQEELKGLEEYEESRKALLAEKENKNEELLKLCREISSLRTRFAETLSKEMLAALKDLNFNDVNFRIDVRPEKGNISENGFDEVEFMISMNVGEEVKSLENIASGGELSRIMLALKTVLADKDSIDTLIFDEIDTGISGRTAQKVAEKLKVLSAKHQVICITHLPQIAAMADHHFMISKAEENGRTITTVQELSGEESVDELSRLLSGAEITDAVRKNAVEMKQMACRMNR